MAYGSEPAARRRESREHAPTLGRAGVLPLGLSTGWCRGSPRSHLNQRVVVGQSEDEEVEAGDDDAAADEDVLVVVVLELEAESEDDVLERLSVR